MLKRIATLVLLLTALACPFAAAESSAGPAPAPAGASVENSTGAQEEHGLMDFDLASAVWTWWRTVLSA